MPRMYWDKQLVGYHLLGCHVAAFFFSQHDAHCVKCIQMLSRRDPMYRTVDSVSPWPYIWRVRCAAVYKPNYELRSNGQPQPCVNLPDYVSIQTRQQLLAKQRCHGNPHLFSIPPLDWRIVVFCFWKTFLLQQTQKNRLLISEQQKTKPRPISSICKHTKHVAINPLTSTVAIWVQL